MPLNATHDDARHRARGRSRTRDADGQRGQVDRHLRRRDAGPDGDVRGRRRRGVVLDGEPAHAARRRCRGAAPASSGCPTSRTRRRRSAIAEADEERLRGRRGRHRGHTPSRIPTTPAAQGPHRRARRHLLRACRSASARGLPSARPRPTTCCRCRWAARRTTTASGTTWSPRRSPRRRPTYEPRQRGLRWSSHAADWPQDEDWRASSGTLVTRSSRTTARTRTRPPTVAHPDGGRGSTC